jgi:hypothetical protein
MVKLDIQGLGDSATEAGEAHFGHCGESLGVDRDGLWKFIIERDVADALDTSARFRRTGIRRTLEAIRSVAADGSVVSRAAGVLRTLAVLSDHLVGT